jgi:hypothetical protein
MIIVRMENQYQFFITLLPWNGVCCVISACFLWREVYLPVQETCTPFHSKSVIQIGIDFPYEL